MDWSYIEREEGAGHVKYREIGNGDCCAYFS